MLQTFGLHLLFKKQETTENSLSFILDVYILVYELLNKHLNFLFYKIYFTCDLASKNNDHKEVLSNTSEKAKIRLLKVTVH